MRRLIASVILSCFIALSVKAEVQIATGFSSVTEGRTIPLISLGTDSHTSAFLLSAVGVKNDVYVHNSYMFSAYRQTEPDQFWWGKVRAGLGGGINYAYRFYKDGGKKDSGADISVGPAIRITWEVIPYAFLGVESYFGLGHLNNIVLSTGQISQLLFGVRF